MHKIMSSSPVLKYILPACLLMLTLYAGRTLFIPLLYGLFIAIVLYPVCKWLEDHRFPRSIAITLSLSLLFVLVAAIAALLVWQVNAFRQDLPLLKEKIIPFIEPLQKWAGIDLQASGQQQNGWWKNALHNVLENPVAVLSGPLNKISSALFMLFIVPVFAALFLYNRKDFVLFLEKIAGDRYNGSLHTMLGKVMNTYFHFIKGMVFVYSIVGVLNSAGLLTLDIDHAVLFGFLTAVMTIIPYIGIFISALLPVTVAWITKDNIWYPLGVIAVFVFVQYLEANVVFPRVVAAQLNLSTWATLVAIIAGGILWGVNGMILFIPIAGILKLITDDIPACEPVNILLRRRGK